MGTRLIEPLSIEPRFPTCHVSDERLQSICSMIFSNVVEDWKAIACLSDIIKGTSRKANYYYAEKGETARVLRNLPSYWLIYFAIFCAFLTTSRGLYNKNTNDD